MTDPRPLSRRSDVDRPVENGANGPPERYRGARRRRGWWAQLADADEQARQPAHAVDASKSRRELYKEAQRAGIEGRSAMNKQQLVEALQRHHATESSTAPAPRPAPGSGWPVAVEPQPWPDAREAEPLRGARPADAAEPERCVIKYRASDRQGEFRVVVTEADGTARTVARSPAFPVQGGETPRSEAARAAHDLLVQRLDVSGWWPAGSAEAWPELEFIRVRPADPDDVRSFVTVVREGGRARFVVEELDGYGNPTPLFASESFRAPRLLPVRPSRQAKGALDDLLLRIEVDGWRFAEETEGEWYAISLRRGPEGEEA
jgi:hypothetical protein